MIKHNSHVGSHASNCMASSLNFAKICKNTFIYMHVYAVAKTVQKIFSRNMDNGIINDVILRNDLCQ